jgi:branched-chain amino acid transport system substrate-binding protein
MFAMRKRIVQLAIGLFFLIIPLGWASAEEGVTDNEIVIGTSQALTGGMAFIGGQNVNGTKIMINEINAKGGINGRKIRQIVMDDAYTTPRHVANLRRMIEQDKIFCFVFNLGTHTVAASLPILNQSKVPLYGAATQGKMFDKEPYVFSDAASWRQLVIQSTRFMMKDRGKQKIGVFYWDNALGLEHLEGAREYLKAIGSSLVAEEKYTDEDQDMSSQATRLKKSGAECVLLGVSPTGGAKIAKAMHNIGYFPEMVGPLMLASPGFFNVAGKDAEGLFIALPFLSPTDDAVAPYRELAKKYYPDKPFDNQVLSGLANVYVFAEGVRRAGKDLTREKFIKAIESISYKNYDMPFYKGAEFYYGPGRHRASSSVIMTQVVNGQLKQVTNWLLWKGIPLPEIE